MEIWINPACSKCRTAQAKLDDSGADYTVRRYLDDPPSVDELRAVVDRMGLNPWDIARMSEPAAQAAGLVHLARDDAHRETWLKAMTDNPSTIQRPIITADDGTTVVGRDPDSLARVLNRQP